MSHLRTLSDGNCCTPLSFSGETPNLDHAVTFARHLSHLLWLLLHEPHGTDEQKATLRALVLASKDGSVNLALFGEALAANATPVPATLTGVTELGRRLASHGLAMVTASAPATPADLLGVARILASDPVSGDGGAAAEAKRVALGIATVRFAVLPPFATEQPPSPEMDFGEVFDDPIAEAEARATPRSSRAIPATPESENASRGGLFDQFAAARAPTGSLEGLLAQLDSETDAGRMSRLLDHLVAFAEKAAREARPAIVCDIMVRITRREPELTDFESKRAFVLVLRRLARAEVLRIVVRQLSSDADRREDCVAILARAGEDGADVVIEQIAGTTQQEDRRLYLDALLRLKAGVPTLLQMLQDSRWFVARNAAELLGELEVPQAEKPLTDLLRHDDERVRRTSNGALMRLGTPRAMKAIRQSLSDRSPAARKEAAAAIAGRKDSRLSGELLRALDDEKDEDVQSAFLMALGKLATEDAVQRLIRCAEAERSLFRRKPAGVRVAAVHALAEARTNEALDALRALLADKDQAVRDAAASGLRRVSRETATS